MHAPWLLRKFSPDTVSMGFSRQYTRIRWRRRSRGEITFDSRGSRDLDKVEEDLYLEFIREIMGDAIRHEGYMHEGNRWFGRTARGLQSFGLAEFDEDIADVVAIRMRWLTVINKTKVLGEVWERILGGISKAYDEGNREDTYLMYIALICASAYCFSVGAQGWDARGPQPARPALAAWWTRNHRKVSTALVGRGYGDVPQSLDEIQPRDDEVVDTKTYWRDWQVWGEEVDG